MRKTSGNREAFGTARQVGGLLAWLLVTFSAAAIGGIFSPGGPHDWYTSPSWAPPDWVFGPVWTALYTMMAVAAWLVWRRRGFSAARAALGVYILQLALNAAWTPVFFGLRMPGAAFVVIVALWVAIAAATVLFWKHSRAAGALFVPYIAWVSFAGALNFSIWRLTPPV